MTIKSIFPNYILHTNNYYVCILLIKITISLENVKLSLLSVGLMRREKETYHKNYSPLGALCSVRHEVVLTIWR